MDDPGSTRDEPLEPPSPVSTGKQGGDGIVVDILDPARRLPGPALAWLGEMSRAAAAALEARGEVRARIVDDAEMADAHLRYKGLPGTTDVLTFDLTDDHPHRPGSAPGPTLTPELDVDIMICADEAARQGAQRGVELRKELLLYIVHGMLHCLGYDDLTPDEAAAMHRREDEVLGAIGVGPVYAGESGPATARTGEGQTWA